jgi:hypothetical protein
VSAAGWEWLGLAGLAGLAVFFLATSWRKWPDPLIDFGRELYLPWRLAHGAVLYRDVDDFYGPLSQYFNAGLFRVFGPGLMVLVGANLAIFTAILAAIYRLFRRAWGPGAAWASAAVFIAVFAFSQLVGIGNYNYATPYAHEATHGLLVCLGLVVVLAAWVERATVRRSFLAGGLFGLAAVLKPEIMLAAGLVTLAALAVQRGQRRPLGLGAVTAWAAGAVLPSAAFMIYFSCHAPWRSAVEMAGRAWWSVAASSRFTGDPVQAGFLGVDQPAVHLREHAVATLIAVLLFAVIGGAAWLTDREPGPARRWFLMSATAAGLAVLAWFKLPWTEAGRALLGLTVIYGLVCLVKLARATKSLPSSPAPVLRLLLVVLAAALLARMVLNGRLYQFGFYQAALAAVLVPAVLIGELPAWLGAGRWGRAMVVVGAVALLGPGVMKLAGQSQQWLRLKTHPVGEGRDRFYALTPQVEPNGDLVEKTSAWLRSTAIGRDQTLLVLPEGEMINYLARMPSPVAPFFFFSAATRGDREAAIVRDLAARPPSWIVVVSRDLREYGVQRYGESPDQGGQILTWVGDNYEPMATFGGDPLDYRQRGAMILRYRR